VRDQGSGHAATHHRDGGMVLARQHWISSLASCGVGKPQRPSDTQPSLRRAQRRHSDDGSRSRASSRSSEQRFAIVSTAMPASRACASARGSGNAIAKVPTVSPLWTRALRPDRRSRRQLA
jgi:hypothetical protein